VREDPELLRPTDAPFQACDATRLRNQTGWRPRIPLDQTLDDILGYWRVQVAAR
jgi:GDP-4-dehydro-6-deoxy-D-mannose reductase